MNKLRKIKRKKFLLLLLPDLSKSTQKSPSSLPRAMRSGSIIVALSALLNNARELSINSRATKTVVLGKLFLFIILCSSDKATTHLFFSPSVSANIKVTLRGPGGSRKDVVICKDDKYIYQVNAHEVATGKVKSERMIKIENDYSILRAIFLVQVLFAIRFDVL